MAEIKIAGIMRAGVYSPNHIGNDAAIFNLVADQLRKRGCEVNIYSEDQFISGAVTEKIILNMCRDPRSIKLLQQLEDDGALVINSGYGIENCVRERMAKILVGSGVPFPESFIVNTDEVVKDRLIKAGFEGCWIKGADVHTMHREDVAQARHAEEAQEILQEFFLRGFKRAVINRHLYGDLIKFYGVMGTPFFCWYYAFDSARRRSQGDVAASKQPTFDVERLKAIGAKCADLLDVKIYGGDCVVDQDGTIRIIDFNDWPSFAPCRAEAAPIIARMILTEIRNRS
jgi:glutathione synthase/RimK-type ligase-like ATP-grasp enzyme